MAGLVADVRIEEEREIASDKLPCGSTYKARVLTVAKGDIKVGQVLAFGFLGGLERGHAYRVYLSPQATPKAWAALLEGRIAAAEAAAWMKTCRDRHPTKTIFFRSDRLAPTDQPAGKP